MRIHSQQISNLVKKDSILVSNGLGRAIWTKADLLKGAGNSDGNFKKLSDVAYRNNVNFALKGSFIAYAPGTSTSSKSKTTEKYSASGRVIIEHKGNSASLYGPDNITKKLATVSHNNLRTVNCYQEQVYMLVDNTVLRYNSKLASDDQLLDFPAILAMSSSGAPAVAVNGSYSESQNMIKYSGEGGNDLYYDVANMEMVDEPQNFAKTSNAFVVLRVVSGSKTLPVGAVKHGSNSKVFDLCVEDNLVSVLYRDEQERFVSSGHFCNEKKTVVNVDNSLVKLTPHGGDIYINVGVSASIATQKGRRVPLSDAGFCFSVFNDLLRYNNSTIRLFDVSDNLLPSLQAEIPFKDNVTDIKLLDRNFLVVGENFVELASPIIGQKIRLH